MFHILWSYGGRIVTAGLVVGGWWADAQGFPVFQGVIWQYWAILGFAVFAFLTIVEEVHLNAGLRELRSERPKPQITLRNDSGTLVLDVENTRGSGEFSCQVYFKSWDAGVRSGVPPGSPQQSFDVPWSSGALKVQLGKGGHDSLQLANQTHGAPGGMIRQDVVFPYTSPHVPFHIGWLLTTPPTPHSYAVLEVRVITIPSVPEKIAPLVVRVDDACSFEIIKPKK